MKRVAQQLKTAPRLRQFLRVASSGSRARWQVATRRCHDAGMATAEYAIATLAACGFAGLLLALLRGSEVRAMLLGIIKRALSV